MPFYFKESSDPDCPMTTNDNLFLNEADCQEICPATFSPVIRLPRGNEILAERGSETATLHVAVRANPPASVQWYHNGRPLSKFDPRYTVTENYLQISKVSDLDAGFYEIKADNGIQTGNIEDGEAGSTASSKLQLIVYPLFPTVKINADKTLFKPGEDLMIPCEVKTYPRPDIKWFKVAYVRGRKRETRIKAGEDERISIEAYPTGTVVTLSQLVFRNASELDAGAYKCEATSAYFEAVSDTEGISVTYGPSSTCIDSPSYSHCDKIVEHKFCGNKCKLLIFKGWHIHIIQGGYFMADQRKLRIV